MQDLLFYSIYKKLATHMENAFHIAPNLSSINCIVSTFAPAHIIAGSAYY